MIVQVVTSACLNSLLPHARGISSFKWRAVSLARRPGLVALCEVRTLRKETSLACGVKSRELHAAAETATPCLWAILWCLCTISSTSPASERKTTKALLQFESSPQLRISVITHACVLLAFSRKKGRDNSALMLCDTGRSISRSVVASHEFAGCDSAVTSIWLEGQKDCG